MTNFLNAAIGIALLNRGDGDYASLTGSRNDALMFFIHMHQPLAQPLLAYQPSKRGVMTHVMTVNGDVERIYRDSGHGEYDHCDTCGTLEDVDFLNNDNMCDKCEEHAHDEDEHDLMEDTPCLDTSFHDYEMSV